MASGHSCGSKASLTSATPTACGRPLTKPWAALRRPWWRICPRSASPTAPGLPVLAWAHQSQAGDGHELIITGYRPIVRRLLSLTGYDMYLHVSDSQADILRLKDVALGQGGPPTPFGLN